MRSAGSDDRSCHLPSLNVLRVWGGVREVLCFYFVIPYIAECRSFSDCKEQVLQGLKSLEGRQYSPFLDTWNTNLYYSKPINPSSRKKSPPRWLSAKIKQHSRVTKFESKIP